MTVRARSRAGDCAARDLALRASLRSFRAALMTGAELGVPFDLAWSEALDAARVSLPDRDVALLDDVRDRWRDRYAKLAGEA